GNSAIRQFGNSAIRQFGNSAIRQFGNSLNRSLTLAFLLALPLSAALTVTAHAQWKDDAANYDIADGANYVTGTADFWFFNTTGTSYDLGAWVFSSMNQATNVSTTTGNWPDLANKLGYRVAGANLYDNTYISSINASGSTIQLDRKTTGASSGDYTLTTTGPAVSVTSGTYAAGSTTLYTGTYDARQLTLGTLVTGAGIAEGTYIRSVNSSGQVTLSQATTGVGSGFTLTGPGAYTNTLNNITYSGTVSVPKDFVYVNTHEGTVNLKNAVANSKLVFTDPQANFIVAIGQISDPWFTVTGALQFLGDATFSTNYGLNPLFSGNISGESRYINGRTNINLSAAVDVAGDFNKTGPDNLYLNGGADNVLTLHGGALNVLDGNFYARIENQTLTSPRVVGAGAINVATTWNRIVGLSMFALHTGYNATSGADYNVIDDAPINLFTGNLQVFGSGTNTINHQTVGAVNLRSGRNVIGWTGNTGNLEGFRLVADSLNSFNGATVVFSALNDSFSAGQATGRFIIKDGGDTNLGLVGTVDSGTAGANVTNLKIVPWAVGNSVDLVTYASGGDKGFRRLAAGEYHATFTDAAADDNVLVSVAETIAAGTAQTINALKITTANDVSITVNGNLNVASGVILNGVNSQSNFIGSGTVSTGNRALIVHGQGIVDFRAGLTIHNTVNGSDIGLIAATNVYLRNNNSTHLHGTVLIEGGSYITLMHDQALTEQNNVRVDMASNLWVYTNNARVGNLAGTGRVYFQSDSQKLTLGAPTGSEIAGTLTVKSGYFIAPGDVDGPLQASALWIGKNISGVEFQAGSIFNVDIAGNSVSDQLAVYTTDTGDKNISSPELTFANNSIIRLNFLDGYTPAEGDTWLLSAGFSGMTLGNVVLEVQDALGAALMVDDGDWTLDIFDNNLRLISNIPEPGTWALLLTGAALLVLLRRRRST
ncbi:MAG: PEP-CTERM sorting domain-containing protein, partial [Verrucomicrobiales bacterium]|nr:PEP-CTERM sorting domain-containing protein [Verrucomicrobiales bacterium]